MDKPIEKNQHYELTITDMGSEGEGIGKINDFTVFIPRAITGDVVEIRIVKVKKSFGYGKLVKLITPSPFRVEPICEVADTCGGCQLQHLSYETQLDWKTKKVKDCLNRIGGLKDIEVLPTLGMGTPYHYRNKAQYPIRQINGKVQTGFFAPRSHQLIPLETCYIQDPKKEAIMKAVLAFLEKYKISIYDEEKHTGLVRHLMIKTGYHTEEMMVCLVINGPKLPHADEFVKAIKAVAPVTSIILNQHLEKSNTILGNSCTVLDGENAIIDYIGDLQFKISPLSFFQVNPQQTEVLYTKALEYAELTGDEIVWDAYCGIGSISLFLAQKAKKVYGVEIIPEAIENAKENAALNHITNAEFYVGKAEEVIPQMYEQGIVADTIVVDPPRKGCDSKLLETLIKMSPNKIVYVSCDPATLARDLAYLVAEGYQVDKVQPVDMFPQTAHVECVVLMSRVEK